MTNRQPSWNMLEAIVLLEAFISTKDGLLSRTDAISRASSDLRKMALNQGTNIDQTFRNESGISFQMHSMESAFYGKTMFKPATKLFTEAARIYHEDRNEYQKLLKEARTVIDGKKTIIDDYMQYLAKKVSPSQLSEFFDCYSEIEAFCMKTKVLQKPLFETTDFEIIKKVQRTIEQNKIFRITHKRQFNKILAACRHYYLYIKEGQFPQSEPEVEKKEIIIATPSAVPAHIELSDAHDTVEQLARTEQDERLLQKYPIIYKRVHSALKASDCALSIGILGEKISRIARPAVLEEILDNVSWAKLVGDEYAFSDEIVDHTVEMDEEERPVKNDDVVANETQEPSASEYEETSRIDFNGDFNLAYSKPESFTYFDEQKPFGSSWTDLYVTFVATICEDYPHLLVPGMSFSNRNSRVELARNDNYSFMIDAKPVPGTDLMLETNISASNMADKIKFILDLCNVDYENVVITYKKKGSTTSTQSGVVSVKPAKTTHQSAFNSISFTRYLKDTLRMAEATCRSYASAINNCESFAKEHDFPSWRLYTDDRKVAEETIKLLMADEKFQEYNTNQHNRFSAALQKFLTFIGSTNITFGTSSPVNKVEQSTPYRNEDYEVVLSQYFKKGFRMESPLEIRKFRRYYSTIHEKELSDSDDVISNNIKSLSILYDGKAFLPDVMLSDDMKTKLYSYIDSAFADGKTAIYYQALYTEFAEDFLDHHIHDADMLKAYLTATGNGRFYIQRSFISKELNVTMDPLSEIRDCLIEYGRPVEYKELFEALPHIPQSKIKFILASNGEFVNNGQGAYFHEKIVRLSDEELEGIAEIISQTIDEKVFMGGNELYDAIKIKYSYIIEENKALSVYGFRDALKAKLGDRFSFKGNIISHSGNELSMADVFAKYAQTHDSFTLSELQGLASNLATVIYFDAVYENSLRVSKERFVSKAMAQFAVSETDDALDRVCTGKYIPICEVQNFGVFPYAGFTWNSYLLEHYVASYSRKYKLLHSGYNGTECAGAIVRHSAGIDSFDDLIIDLLVNNPIEMKKAPVLQYLSDKGYLARRRYSEIESLIIKAKAQKQRKDD